MARLRTAFAISLSALAIVGCGRGSLVPAKPAEPEVETRIVPQKQPLDLPRLIAPPPAYGNKIVLAEVATSRRKN